MPYMRKRSLINVMSECWNITPKTQKECVYEALKGKERLTYSNELYTYELNQINGNSDRFVVLAERNEIENKRNKDYLVLVVSKEGKILMVEYRKE